MIKCKTKVGSDDLIILGITEENVKRLKEGRPISVKGKEVGLDNLKIAIFYAETDQGLVDEINQFIGPKTKIHVDPQLDLQI